MTGNVRRAQNQPAWLLHHRPFRDTSRIIDIVSREHGRMALVARGVRSAKSRLRGVLRPFLPLSVSWFIRSDLGTLTGAEMDGSPLQLTGDALLSGYYVNELLLKLLHRHDPQPEIFDAYAATIQNLAGNADVVPLLRRFEMELLRLLGYGLNLKHDSETLMELHPEQRYEFRADQGAVMAAEREGSMIFLGRQLIAIDRQEFFDSDTLHCANRLLRNVIAHRLDGKELKSRKVLRDLKRSAESITGNSH